MTTVPFCKYHFRIEKDAGKQFIFDEVRKKMVPLTPEEWVRQHILHYLLFDKNYSRSRMAVERGITFNDVPRRFDIVVFDTYGQPKMVIECKAPEEKLNEEVFLQIARYNLSLHVEYLWVSNGTTNFCCRIKDGVEWLTEIPDFEQMM